MTHRNTVRVLLIEDDPDDAFLVEDMLAEAGDSNQFVMQHAPRLEEGLERLAEGSIDVVLLDLNLPDAYGAQTFKRLGQIRVGNPQIVYPTNGGNVGVYSCHGSPP